MADRSHKLFLAVPKVLYLFLYGLRVVHFLHFRVKALKIAENGKHATW